MFDIYSFYEKCNNSDKIDKQQLYEYINSFDHIVIWGSAGMGKAVGHFLEENNFKNIIYWDQRADEIQYCNGTKVILPFTGNDQHKEKTLVFYCIPNHVIMTSLIETLKNHGYQNIIRGDIFYSGLICGFTKNSILTADKCWRSGECRAVICEKAKRINMLHNPIKSPGERLDLTYNCFIINSICNMNCMHCVQYINNYPPSKKINIDYKNIARDIDIFFNIIDSVNVVSVMGGETFMHPELNKIIKKFTEKKNFGFISFPTNGLYPIRREQLEGIEDPRVIIAFGYYLHRATEKQKEIYQKNIELVKSLGIAYTESRYLPTWEVPSGIYRFPEADEAYMTAKKQACPMPPRNLQIRDGKVHVCDRGVALYAMGVVDYPTDYFDLVEQKEKSLVEQRDNFRKFINRPFYETCGHCGASQGIAHSAEQGVIDVFNPSTYQKIENFRGICI